MAAGGEAFPRAVRLRASADFRRLQREGLRLHVPHLVVRYRFTDRSGPRFGLVVSRKVGNAVVRNRVKRWLREALRREKAGLPGVDVSVIARSSAPRASAAELRQSVAEALRRIREAR